MEWKLENDDEDDDDLIDNYSECVDNDWLVGWLAG